MSTLQEDVVRRKLENSCGSRTWNQHRRFRTRLRD